MSTKQISFNNFDLQDSHFLTKDIIYRNLPSKIIDVETRSRRDGFFYMNSYYENKEIRVSGVLSRDSEANLKTSLDSMKESLYTNESNLDIDDGSGTMRFVASVKSINIPEEHYHITSIPYEIVFLCEPFGKATSTTQDIKTITHASASPYESTLNPTGSIGPLPKLKWLCASLPTTPITQIVFENTSTNRSITVPSLSLDAINDYLEIDTDEMTVKVSYDGGSETSVDFTGVFPTFIAGVNNYKCTITGGGASFVISQYITYYPLFL